jgi:hypothetical protein
MTQVHYHHRHHSQARVRTHLSPSLNFSFSLSISLLSLSLIFDIFMLDSLDFCSKALNAVQITCAFPGKQNGCGFLPLFSFFDFSLSSPVHFVRIAQQSSHPTCTHATSLSCPPLFFLFFASACQPSTCSTGQFYTSSCGTWTPGNCTNCTRCTNLQIEARGCTASADRLCTNCGSNLGNCDGIAANSCETDLMTSVTHCGRCGNNCSAVENSVRSCSGGACTFSCNQGYFKTGLTCQGTFLSCCLE